MFPTFDIFKADSKGGLLWCGASATLDDAKSKVQLFKNGESEFVIFNQETQESTIIKSDSHASSATTST